MLSNLKRYALVPEVNASVLGVAANHIDDILHYADNISKILSRYPKDDFVGPMGWFIAGMSVVYMYHRTRPDNQK